MQATGVDNFSRIWDPSGPLYKRPTGAGISAHAPQPIADRAVLAGGVAGVVLSQGVKKYTKRVTVQPTAVHEQAVRSAVAPPVGLPYYQQGESIVNTLKEYTAGRGTYEKTLPNRQYETCKITKKDQDLAGRLLRERHISLGGNRREENDVYAPEPTVSALLGDSSVERPLSLEEYDRLYPACCTPEAERAAELHKMYPHAKSQMVRAESSSPLLSEEDDE